MFFFVDVVVVGIIRWLSGNIWLKTPAELFSRSWWQNKETYKIYKANTLSRALNSFHSCIHSFIWSFIRNFQMPKLNVRLLPFIQRWLLRWLTWSLLGVCECVCVCVECWFYSIKFIQTATKWMNKMKLQKQPVSGQRAFVVFHVELLLVCDGFFILRSQHVVYVCGSTCNCFYRWRKKAIRECFSCDKTRYFHCHLLIIVNEFQYGVFARACVCVWASLRWFSFNC